MQHLLLAKLPRHHIIISLSPSGWESGTQREQSYCRLITDLFVDKQFAEKDE